MQAYWETGDESMLDALQEYNEWKFTDLELDEIRRQVDPEDQQDYLDYVRQTMFTREFYPSVFDAELEVPELEVKKAGGGKIKKGISRRDFLKGAAAAGTTGALGAGVIGTKKGALDPAAEGAAAATRDALAAGARKAWSKQDMTPRQWETIDKYLIDQFEDLLEQLAGYESTESGRLSQQQMREVMDIEAELDQIDWIRGADEDYVFDPSAQEYLEEFVTDTASDLGLEIHDYGDWDNVDDPRVQDQQVLERLITPRREHVPEDVELQTIREALEMDDPRGPRTMGGAGPREKLKKAGGGSVKKALQRLQNARRALEQESDPDIELIGRSLMQDEDPTLRNVGQRIVRNEARVANQEMSFEEAQKYYERISRLLDEAGARLGEWFKDGRPDPGD